MPPPTADFDPKFFTSNPKPCPHAGLRMVSSLAELFRWSGSDTTTDNKRSEWRIPSTLVLKARLTSASIAMAAVYFIPHTADTSVSGQVQTPLEITKLCWSGASEESSNLRWGDVIVQQDQKPPIYSILREYPLFGLWNRQPARDRITPVAPFGCGGTKRPQALTADLVAGLRIEGTT